MKTASVVRDGAFVEVADVQADVKKRIVLKRVKKPGKAYRIYENSHGQILLDPLVTIPAAEAWLYKNEAALDAVRRGLRDSAAGKLTKKPSLARYADDATE